jgi:hypothetical protein
MWKSKGKKRTSFASIISSWHFFHCLEGPEESTPFSIMYDHRRLSKTGKPTYATGQGKKTKKENRRGRRVRAVVVSFSAWCGSALTAQKKKKQQQKSVQDVEEERNNHVSQ